MAAGDSYEKSSVRGKESTTKGSWAPRDVISNRDGGSAQGAENP